ncbi:MAG: T9SS type A sorting domain-containing protein [Rhodothermales bacterium]
MKTTFLLLLAGLLGGTAHAQIPIDSIIVQFEAPPGTRMANIFTTCTTVCPPMGANLDDANGDRVPDLLMTQVDDQGRLMALRVVDLKTRDILWQVDDVGQELGLFGVFPYFGFANPDGDTVREAIFANEADIRVYNPRNNTLEWSWAETVAGKQSADSLRLQAVLDLDNDGLEEFIITTANPARTQVWGTEAVATANESTDEVPERARLEQNYPNPFRTFTTITYTVEQNGPVTVTIYDMLGRRVRALVDMELPPGMYRIAWDGTDDAGRPVASGAYFYRLRIDDFVSSKQAIRVK